MKYLYTTPIDIKKSSRFRRISHNIDEKKLKILVR